MYYVVVMSFTLQAISACEVLLKWLQIMLGICHTCHNVKWHTHKTCRDGHEEVWPIFLHQH